MTDFKDKKITELTGSRAVFSRNLREIVVQVLGWTRKHFGQELGCSSAQASKYLSGLSTPPFEMMDRIEQKTGVAIAEFYNPDFLSILGRGGKSAILKKVSEASGIDLTEIHIVESPNDTRLEDFMRDISRDLQISEAFLDLLTEGADAETLRIEFLREYCQTLIADGGPLASRAKKVLSDILNAEKGAKK